MENAEEIQLVLERYSRLKPKEIPDELEEYMGFVAKTGDTVFKWPLIQHLFREKLMNVITDFHDSSPSISDLPHYPNVDPFNFELMKKNLIERMESFNSAPFTIQRICELLTEPRKQYSRIDKFMRAIEKNILVVSTMEPGRTRHESENGESLDSTVNGDLMSDGGNLDVGSSEEEQNVSSERPQTDEAGAPYTADPRYPNARELVGLPLNDRTPREFIGLPVIEPNSRDFIGIPVNFPLEKLEPEVNVLTVESNEPVSKDEDAEEVTEAKEPTESSDATDSKNASETVAGETFPSETPTNDAENDENTEETKVEKEEITASPSKRENENPVEENVNNKKAKLEDETSLELTELIPESTNSSENVENIAPEPTPPISEEPVITPEEPSPAITEDETTTDEVLPEPTPTENTENSIEPEPVVEPLPPIETISNTNLEQQTNLTQEAAATATEDEDLMKVDPLIPPTESKMQTDDVDETATSAMDVDESSGDYME